MFIEILRASVPKLVDFYFGPHPGVNAALELDGMSRRENVATGGWTIFLFSGLYEDICGTVGLRLEHHTWNDHCARRAFWDRVRVARKRVQWKDEPTAEFCDLSERVYLAPCVAEAECLTNRHGRVTGSKHPKESVLMLRKLSDEFIKRRFTATDTGSWKWDIERGRFAIVSDQDGPIPFFRLADDRKDRKA